MSEKTKILYLDDEEINIMIFEMNFSKKFDVISGLNGHEGLKLLETHPDIKVVVSDMKMPGMTGLEFIKLARVKHPNIAYYILTGFEITDEIQQALNQKIILEYFKKPFDLKKIAATLESNK